MSSAPAVLSLGTANPTHRYSQEAVYHVAQTHSPFYRSERIRQVFLNSDIEHRYFCLDLERFNPSETPDDLHERFTSGALDIGGTAIKRCLDAGGMDIGEIDYFIAVSCTGYLCPGLTSLLGKELGMRTNIQRADLLGMGCAGAMPGLQRAYDFVKAYPEKKALLLTVEICSACYYIDESLETVVGNAICGDGAAAVVVGMSDDPALPKIIGFETLLEPAYINTVGFEHRQGKLRIVLSKDIRDVAGTLGRTLCKTLLERFHLNQEAISHWILHSGGRKVIDSLQREMHLTPEQLRHSKCVLKNFGNMSSPTVLFVLDEALRSGDPRPGDYGVMLAMGPGLAIESALVQW